MAVGGRPLRGRDQGGPRRGCARTGRERGGAPRAAAGWDVGRREDPAVGAGPAEAQKSRRPAPGGEEVCKAPVPAGSGRAVLFGGSEGHPRRAPPETGERKENWDLSPFVSWEGNGEAAVSSLGIYGVGGGPLGGDWWEGGRLPDWRTKSRALGRRGRPPLLPAETCPQRLRGETVGSTSLTQAWLGGIHCSFVPRKGKNGAEVPAAMLWPRSSACLVYTHVPLEHLPGCPLRSS